MMPANDDRPAVNGISNKAIRFICLSFLVEVLFFPSCYFILRSRFWHQIRTIAVKQLTMVWQYLGITRARRRSSPASVELHGHFVPAL